MAGRGGVMMSISGKRAVWIVLDGVGLDALPDAKLYGDEEAATLPHVAMACGGLNLPNLQHGSTRQRTFCLHNSAIREKVGTKPLARLSNSPLLFQPKSVHSLERSQIHFSGFNSTIPSMMCSTRVRRRTARWHSRSERDWSASR